MMSANQRSRRAAAALLALLLLGTAPSLAAAGPLVAIRGVAVEAPDSVVERYVSPGGRLVEIRTHDGLDGGVNALVDRTLRYVDEFDPGDDLPTQVRNFETFAMDAVAIARDSVDCVVFVADPDFLDRIAVDFSGAPERVRVELPFAMPSGSGPEVSMGYLLIVIQPSGELECGLGIEATLLS